MKRNWLNILSIFVILFQFVGALIIDYPPMSGQIILGFNVWIIRSLSLLISSILILIYLKGWHKFIVLISPIYWVLWYLYPLILLELLLWVVLIRLIKRNKLWLFALLFVVFVRFGLQGRSFILSDKLKIKDLSMEVETRFGSEDILSVRPVFPLWFRRFSYNKPFFAIKNVLKETNSFLNVETLFFGEFHPLEQKGIVIFYWFEIFLLVIGIYFWLKKKKKDDILFYLGFSFIYFLLSKESLFLRFGLLWYVLSYFIALSIKKANVFLKICFVFVLIYSFVINFFNFIYRSDFWFDNRPLVFEYCFKNLPEKNNVYVTKVFGNTNKYCNYYWGDECALNDNLEKSKYVCLFAGELLERKFDNSIADDWKNAWSDKGYKILMYKQMKDSVAYGYSDYLVIGELK